MKEEIDENPEYQDIQPNQGTIEKVKKPRTEKQIAATQKMLEAKKKREDELRELREFKEQKKIEEEERLSKLVNEKI
ncbi:unnamed protein product, partial [Sphagnum jensenii]